MEKEQKLFLEDSRRIADFLWCYGFEDHTDQNMEALEQTTKTVEETSKWGNWGESKDLYNDGIFFITADLKMIFRQTPEFLSLGPEIRIFRQGVETPLFESRGNRYICNLDYKTKIGRNDEVGALEISLEHLGYDVENADTVIALFPDGRLSIGVI